MLGLLVVDLVSSCEGSVKYGYIFKLNFWLAGLCEIGEFSHFCIEGDDEVSTSFGLDESNESELSLRRFQFILLFGITN